MQQLPTSPTNSGELSSRDLAILVHVGLYGLTFPHPVQRLFFPDDQFDSHEKALERAGNALHGLASAKLLTSTIDKKRLQFNKDYRYWILTVEGGKLIEMKPSRIKPTSKPNKDLAILWACTMSHKRFHRLEHKEVAALFPDNPPHHHVTHLIAEQEYDEGKSTSVVYRVLHSLAEPKQIVRQARKQYEESLSNDSLRPLVERGDYGFAILVPTEDRRGAVQKLVSKAEGNKTALSHLARFTVRLGPTTETLRETIQRLHG